MTQPIDDLVQPQPVELIPNLLDQIVVNNTSLFSPTAWILKAIELIPRAKEAIDGVEYHFFGDWNSVLVIADALNHLADFSDDLAVEVHVANANCKANWDGNAAEAAYDYFETLHTDLGKHGPALRQAAKDLQDVAFGMESEAQALKARCLPSSTGSLSLRLPRRHRLPHLPRGSVLCPGLRSRWRRTRAGIRPTRSSMFAEKSSPWLTSWLD